MTILLQAGCISSIQSGLTGYSWLKKLDSSKCSSQTKKASAGTCRWPGCCCRCGSCPCLCPSPCPCFHVCAYACVCACASSFSSCARGGGGDGGGHVRHCVWRTKKQPLWKRTAPVWRAWRAWTVRLTVALYLKREREGKCLSALLSIVVLFLEW